MSFGIFLNLFWTHNEAFSENGSSGIWNDWKWHTHCSLHKNHKHMPLQNTMVYLVYFQNDTRAPTSSTTLLRSRNTTRMVRNDHEIDFFWFFSDASLVLLARHVRMAAAFAIRRGEQRWMVTDATSTGTREIYFDTNPKMIIVQS